MSEDKHKHLKPFLIYICFIILSISIIVRIVMIQTHDGRELREEAREKRLRHKAIDPIRGNIYACDGRLLATSVPIFDIRMDVANPNIHDTIFNKEVIKLSEQLSALFGGKSARSYEAELRHARKTGQRYFLIKRKATYPQLNKLKTFAIFEKGKYGGGLIIIPKTRRELLFRELAKRTIGYTSKESKTTYRVGLEGAYDSILKGSGGARLEKKIAGDLWVPLSDEWEKEPENGYDILTTIDINLQDVAENALMKRLQIHDAHHGCAIVMEVKTGKIKAIANLTKSPDGSYRETYNYAVGESTEPGSTFKLPVIMAALEDGRISLDKKVKTGEGWKVWSGVTMKDVHKIGDGNITAREAFEHSSNVGMSTLIVDAYKKDPGEFIARLHKFRLNNMLGLEISGEGKPYIKMPSDKSWSALSLPWMAHGYEVHITPMQLLCFYNAVANEGIMVKPRFVEEVSSAGKLIKKTRSEVITKKLCSDETLRKAKELLEGVVENGTAKNLKNPLYKIAGKTGTAQIANNATGYDKKSYKASFIGYFPADDPAFTCAVIINNPNRKGIYGGTVAGPVFKEIADKVYATYLRSYKNTADSCLKDNLPEVCKGPADNVRAIFKTLGKNIDETENIQEFLYARCSKGLIQSHAIKIDEYRVPDVKDMGPSSALFMLEKAGLEPVFHGKGKVVKQSIAAGTKVNKGRRIDIYFGV